MPHKSRLEGSAPEETAPKPEVAFVERRIAKRYHCDGFAEVVVPASGFLMRGEVADLSEFGCYVKTRARLAIRRSAEVELRFSVNGDNFSVIARAALVKPGVGVGFEFSVIEPHIHRKLVELIEEFEAREAE